MIICKICDDGILIELPDGCELSSKIDTCGRCLIDRLTARGLLDRGGRRAQLMHNRSTDRRRARQHNN